MCFQRQYNCNEYGIVQPAAANKKWNVAWREYYLWNAIACHVQKLKKLKWTVNHEL